MGIVTIAPTALLLPLGPPLVVLVLGERWRPAGWATMALVGVPLCGGLSSVMSEGLKSVARPEILTRTTIVSVVLTPVLMLAFVPLGLVGVSGAASLTSLATTAYLLRTGSRALQIPVRAILGGYDPR